MTRKDPITSYLERNRYRSIEGIHSFFHDNLGQTLADTDQVHDRRFATELAQSKLVRFVTVRMRRADGSLALVDFVRRDLITHLSKLEKEAAHA